jgi:hypothetical protein
MIPDKGHAGQMNLYPTQALEHSATWRSILRTSAGSKTSLPYEELNQGKAYSIRCLGQVEKHHKSIYYYKPVWHLLLDAGMYYHKQASSIRCHKLTVQ